MPNHKTALVDLPPSFFEQDRQQIRYSSFTTTSLLADTQASGSGREAEKPPVKRKSPFKAFALSAILPGAGQFYCGSKIKPLVFLGVEAAAWGFYLKFHNDGNAATDAFEKFNEEHWSRSDYEEYLLGAYGETDDELIIAREVSHHLPDGNTQQYYEMTGKYNQFAWGWDDAVLNGNTLDYYVTNHSVAPITGDSSTPSSARRMIYESMRADANGKYDRADRMIFVAMINRLVSGFEAFFSARKINDRVAGGTSAFSRVDVDVSLKSYNSRRDTPYMKLSYKF
ncbi:MAG: hypothetical protein NTW07_07665 [candidate division Zixibacteria bacterium]|nr:hypothetical protein [candidate division Zixibacteria bacterium]